MLKLRLSDMRVDGLVNLGSMFDKQDPCVQVKLGQQTFTTERKADAGIAAKFDEVCEFELTLAEFSMGVQIEVEVVNKNALGFSSHIGIYSSKLLNVINVFDKPQELVFELIHNGKKGEIKQGKFFASALLQTMAIPERLDGRSEYSNAASIEPWQLRLSNLSASNLVNTGSMLDCQDPSLCITICQQVMKTARQQDAGVNANFPEIFDIKIERGFPVVDVLVEVSSVNAVGFAKHIGTGSLSLRRDDLISQAAEFTISLVHHGKKGDIAQGCVMLTCSAADASEPEEDEDTRTGTAAEELELLEMWGPLELRMSNIRALELMNTGSLLDGQDPCVQITLADDVFITERQSNAGVNATFSETFDGFVESDDFNDGFEMSVEVFSKNDHGTLKHVGVGTVALNSAVRQVGVPVEVTVDLIFRSKKGNVAQGKVMMTVVMLGRTLAEVIKEEDEAEAARLQEEAEYALLHPGEVIESVAAPEEEVEVDEDEREYSESEGSYESSHSVSVQSRKKSVVAVDVLGPREDDDRTLYVDLTPQLEEAHAMIETLQQVVADLNRRLINAQHTMDAHKQIAQSCTKQAEAYKAKISEVSNLLRFETTKNASSERKKIRNQEAEKYEKEKQRAGQLHEDLRMAIIDHSISGIKREPMKIDKMRKKLEALEMQQSSQKLLVQHLVQFDAMAEDLSNAAQHGNLQVCSMLLRRGAAVNEVDSAGYLPLHYACAEGHLEVAKLLLEYGADATAYLSGYSPCEVAARHGHGHIVRLLMDFGGNVDEKGLGGYPPIVAAVANGFLVCVNELISMGADVNGTDLGGNTALHVAVHAVDPIPVIRLLLRRGANTKLENLAGYTPLKLAFSLSKTTAIEALGGRSAMVDEADLGSGQSTYSVASESVMSEGMRLTAGPTAGPNISMHSLQSQSQPLLPTGSSVSSSVVGDRSDDSHKVTAHKGGSAAGQVTGVASRGTAKQQSLNQVTSTGGSNATRTGRTAAAGSRAKSTASLTALEGAPSLLSSVTLHSAPHQQLP